MKIRRIRPTIPPSFSPPTLSLIRILSDKVIRCPITINMKVAKLINPIPPTSIKKKIIPLPNELQCSVVDTTVNPVTVMADVAVKMAFSKEV